MAIETNTNEQPQAAPQSTFAPQSEATAPAGTMDFVNITSRIGLQRIDSTIEPYLEKVFKFVKDNLPNIELVRMIKSHNAYAFQYTGPDGILSFFNLKFISASDPISQNLIPNSVYLNLVEEEINQRFADKRRRISDSRIVLAGYAPDMDRAYEMADCIVRSLQVTAIPEFREAQITTLTTNEFVADWNLSEARKTERLLSPHGIAPRIDVGLTLKAKIRTDLGRELREYETDYRPLGVIGGYTEIRDREEFVINGQRVMLYRPVFNITVCNSVIPIPGVGAILMAALAPTIYNTLFWARQWQDLSDGAAQPGLLEENPDKRGSPIQLKDQEELQDFVRTYFAQPVITFQFQDGRDNIPGLWRLASDKQDVKAQFFNNLSNFFATEQENVGSFEPARIIETRYDGAYGDPNGVLHDSRDIDYLYVAARNGVGSIDAAMRRVLLGGSDRPEDRARIVSNVTNSFIPLWFDNVTAINPEFIKWVVGKTDQRRLVIVDPNSQMESRSLGSFLNDFSSAQNIGSIVSHGVTSRGLNLGSIWNR